MSKTVLITGAASGIGKSLALKMLIEESCKIVLLDKDENRLTTFYNELNNSKDVEMIHCDISSNSHIESFVKKIGKKPIDILINNAGLFYSGSFEKMSMYDFETIINTNLIGTVRMTKALIPNLLKRKQASIVNISSAAGLIGAPGMCAYATSKFGIIGFSDALRAELGKRIHVSMICPMFVKTNIAEHSILSSCHASGSTMNILNSMNTFLSKVGSTPEYVASKIIYAIKNKKDFVLINPETHVIYHLNRFFPKLSRLLIKKVYGQLLQRGVVNL